MKKRLFSLLLAVFMVLSVAACSSSSTGSSTSTDTTAATDATDKETAPADTTEAKPEGNPDDPQGYWKYPYEETVKVTIVNGEVSTARYPEGMDIYYNPWTKAFKDVFNVEVVTEWVSSEYDTKLNLSIASKQLPDMFSCNNVQFQQLVEADMVQDLKPSYDKYASASMKRMMEVEDPDIFETAFEGDKLMGIPMLHYGYECSTSFLWLKKNWMEEAGNPEIKTIADFDTLLRGFKETHGKEYAIALDKALNCFYYLAPSFHAYPRAWLDDGTGNIVRGGIMPEMKPMLAQWAQWYKDGLVRKDFATLDFEAMKPDLINGDIGFIAGENWYSWVLQDAYKVTGDGTWFEAYDLPSVDGEKVMYPINFPNGGYNVVSKGCKNPEVLVKLNDYYIWWLNDAVPEGVPIEDVLPFTENDIHHTSGPFKIMFHSYGDIKEVISAINTKEENFSTGYAVAYYTEIMKWYNDKDFNSIGRFLQMGQNRASLVMACDYVDNNQLLKSKLWGNSPQEVLDYGTTLNDLLTEGFTKIIMGVEPIDYFDTLVAEWKAAGGDEATKAVNDMYGTK